MQKIIKETCEKIIGEKVKKLVAIKGGLSPRRYYKIFSGKKILIASQTPLHQKDRFDDFLTIQSLLESSGVRVPKIIGTDQKKQIIVQENLGDETLQRYVSKYGKNSEMVKQKYLECLKVLVNMQNINSTIPILKERAFNYKNITDEYKSLIEPYLSDEQWQDFIDKLSLEKFYKFMAKTLNRERKVFCHRDFQSSNIMIHEDKLVVIDFQAARLATCFYDLVSLIDDNYILLSISLKSELKDYYNQRTLKISKDKFNYLYNLALFQRKLHDAAIFTREFNLKRDKKSKKYLQNCLNTCERIIKEFI